jgi:uncharacterized protein YciI
MRFIFKSIVLGSFVLLLPQCVSIANKTEKQMIENINASVFDAKLAKELGADEYGMKAYVMAFLKVGPNRERSEEESAQLQRAHLENIKRMAKEGKLLVAGPFLDEGELRGIYIFNVETVEAAKALSETDPAIQAGSLVLELKPWYGPAGLQKLLEIQATISEKSI